LRGVREEKKKQITKVSVWVITITPIIKRGLSDFSGTAKGPEANVFNNSPGSRGRILN
jgi:hypothetical protein